MEKITFGETPNDEGVEVKLPLREIWYNHSNKKSRSGYPGLMKLKTISLVMPF